MKYDIVDYYPSISEELLDRAFRYAGRFTLVKDEDVRIVKSACRVVLFDDDDNTWIKKSTGENFDISMGSFQGAEVCELVGLYLLDRVTQVLGKSNVGLYRDDGLAVLYNASGVITERLIKRLHTIFKKEGLKITVEAGLQKTDFLDVTFDLEGNKFYPYRKPNNKPLYVHRQSNHPNSIIKQLPKMIQKRLSSISCNEEEFDRSKGIYMRRH